MANYYSISFKRLTKIHGFVLDSKYNLESAIESGIHIQTPLGKKILFKLSKSSKNLLLNDSQPLQYLTSEHLLNNGLISFYEFEDSGKGFRISLRGSAEKQYANFEDIIEEFELTRVEKDKLLTEMVEKDIEHLKNWGIINGLPK
jgi:hypothetical protein